MLIYLFRYLVSTFRWMCVTRSISQRDFGSQLFKYMCCVIAIVYQMCDVWGEESLNSTYKIIFGNNSGLYQCLQNREQLSSSLAFSEGSPWVPGEIQSWRPVQRSFDFPFAVSLTTLLNTLVNLPGDLRHLEAYAASMKLQKWYGMEVISNWYVFRRKIHENWLQCKMNVLWLLPLSFPLTVRFRWSNGFTLTVNMNRWNTQQWNPGYPTHQSWVIKSHLPNTCTCFN